MGQLVVQLRPGVELRLNRRVQAPTGTAVHAPHVGTLLEYKAEGTFVALGETLGVLELLGERINIAAPIAGMIGPTLFAVGALVEYGEPLVWLEDLAD
jgi:biotin carboxyl carrier protein